MNQQMNVLFIGLGGIGQRHLRILNELFPEYKITAYRKNKRTFEICDNLKINKRVNIEDKYSIISFNSIDQALKSSPDFAIVSNPTSLHVSTALQLAKEKIPILIEKPLSDSTEGLDELVHLSEVNNTFIMVGYMMRFNPCAKLLKQYIDDGALGRIYNIIINVNSYMPSWHEYEDYKEFYAGRKDLGGGVILTEIHEIDLLHWFFGPPIRVTAIGGKMSNLDIEVEDTVSVIMEQNHNKHTFPISINMSFVQKTPLRDFLILGEYGQLKWNILSNDLVFNDYEHDQHNKHVFPNFDRNDMFRDQMNHFIECLNNKKSPITEIKKIMGGHKTALAIKESMGKKEFTFLEP